jgi:hypothetical protein
MSSLLGLLGSQGHTQRAVNILHTHFANMGRIVYLSPSPFSLLITVYMCCVLHVILCIGLMFPTSQLAASLLLGPLLDHYLQTYYRVRYTSIQYNAFLPRLASLLKSAGCSIHMCTMNGHLAEIFR